MKKYFLSILIFTLFLFTFYPTVKASTVPIMDESKASAILNYYKNLDSYPYYVRFAPNISDDNYFNIINNLTSEQLVTNFNEIFSNWEGSDITWNDISIVIAKGELNSSTIQNAITIFYIVSNNTLEQSSFPYIRLGGQQGTYQFIGFMNTYTSTTVIKNTNNELDISIKNNLTVNQNCLINPYITPSGDYFNLVYMNNLGNSDTVIFDGINYFYNPYFLELQNITNNSSGDSESGDNGTYYNYDYNEYFIRPYIKIETINGLTQYLADSYTIPFSVYSQSGDEYYPFDSLKMDLRVLKSITDYSGEKLETHFVSMVDSYKRFSGNFADTTGYSDFVTNGNILQYNYDLKNKFDSNFVNQYLNDATNKEQYAFQLVLYDFWGDILSISDVFYFYDANNLNNKPLIEAFGGDSSINSSFDSTNTADFSSLVKTFTDFMSTIMSFWSFLPAWLITLLTLGITSAIAIRILGR